MSSIVDLSDTASVVGSASHLDGSDTIADNCSLMPSSPLTPSVSRRRTSPIWKHCRIEDGKSLPAAWVGHNGTKWWHCRPYFDKKREKKYNCSGGSSTIVHHLRREHNIIISLRQEAMREVTQNCLGDITSFLRELYLLPRNEKPRQGQMLWTRILCASCTAATRSL
ncbi:Proteinase inhibitor I78 [Metarhizium robertsii ARSEF 23]|uniref:Proteinase inhibitor I78 n=1 Tax=Metarhizium robertsii (strain ARSEF 23 / ATCC MYA-3075) TaxID=655844 RepID=A0A0B2XHC1_METRA|nr:Proteinase inhibitor I78 [Metarhizium robertsii ARSEF 23]KHO11384.1 Proteinase inhibitor I78 [Metarhizium robertsii ARSEF 23]